MRHNHQTRTYPAEKMFPKALAKLYGNAAKFAKRQHNRKARRYRKHVTDDGA